MQRVDRDTSADTLYTARSAKKRNCCHMRTSWYPVVTRGSTEEAIPGDETRGVVERVREHALIVGAEETITAGGGGEERRRALPGFICSRSVSLVVGTAQKSDEAWKDCASVLSL